MRNRTYNTGYIDVVVNNKKNPLLYSLLLGIITGVGSILFTIYKAVTIILKATIGWTIPWLLLAGVLLLITYW